MTYGYTKEVGEDFEKAIRTLKEKLAEEGFGVLFEIDVQETLKKKMDVDFDQYVILGACNPPLAHRALVAEKEMGLLLPCNIVVYEKDGKVFVSAIVPTVAMQGLDNDTVREIATEAEAKLKSAIDALPAA